MAARATTLLLAMAAHAHAATLVDGLGGPAGYGAHRLELSDNGSSGAVDLTSAFSGGFPVFSARHTAFYVNNNGNITFDAPFASPSPHGLPILGVTLVAPWWGDVDTRGGTLADGTRDAVYWDMRPGAVTVTWHNVGYNDSHDDLSNDFQLMLTSANACGSAAGAWDVTFRYHQCQWVAGDASGGAHGHGGVAAVAGFDAGDGVHYDALPGSLTESVAGLCDTSNVDDPGVWRFRVGTSWSPCAGADAPCDTGEWGVCASGITQCTGGLVSCAQNMWPSAEQCDGIDNNCNGAVDEGPNLCTPGELCWQGGCVPVCGTGGTCGTGRTCIGGEACVETACQRERCPPGAHCAGGACVDACATIACPFGTACRWGACVAPCDGVACPTGQVCENGACKLSCACRACAPGYGCAPDGTCEPADCMGAVCPPGTVCVPGLLGPQSYGNCVDPCATAVCPPAQSCVAGRCVTGGSPDADGGVDAFDAGGPQVQDGGSPSTRTVRDDGVRPAGTRGGCSCAIGSQRGCAGSMALSFACAVLTIAARRGRRRIAISDRHPAASESAAPRRAVHRHRRPRCRSWRGRTRLGSHTR